MEGGMAMRENDASGTDVKSSFKAKMNIGTYIY